MGFVLLANCKIWKVCFIDSAQKWGNVCKIFVKNSWTKKMSDNGQSVGLFLWVLSKWPDIALLVSYCQFWGLSLFTSCILLPSLMPNLLCDLHWPNQDVTSWYQIPRGRSAPLPLFHCGSKLLKVLEWWILRIFTVVNFCACISFITFCCAASCFF